MHSNYGGSILDYDGDDLDNMCGDVLEGFLAGPTRYGLGELDPYMDNYYDERSHIDKALGTSTEASTGFRASKIGTSTPTKYSEARLASTGIRNTSTMVTKSLE